MAFSLDRIVDYVQINEPDLISIHRSTKIIVPSDDSCLGHLCEAFICAARENKSIRVYVALYDTRQKSNLVFVADPISSEKRMLNALIREAEIFLNDLGFSMEPVNIKFSPAVREVIMRDMKIMKPPNLVVGKLKSEPEFEEQAVSADREFALSARLAEATAATERLASEKDELSRKASKEFKKIKAERDSLKRELDAAISAGHEVTSGLGTLRCRMSETQTDLNNENSKLREEIEQLHAERETATATLSSELEDLRSALKKANASIKEGRTKIVERDDSTATLSKEVEALRAALSMADESLRAERAKNESALQEMDALERNAAVELKSLKKKVDSLSTEKRLLESMAAEMKLKAKGEIEHLQQVNQSQRRAAVKKVNALKEEIRQLAEARAVMTSPFGAALNQESIVDLPPLPETRQVTTSRNGNVRDSIDIVSSPFASIGLDDNINFEPDNSLKGIPYTVPEDVVEVYRSFNKIHAAPTGKMVQKCDGFVCMVKNGAKRSVFAAWYMNDTGQVLVCRPETVSGGCDDARYLVVEGVGYFERIGFMMDRLQLEGNPDRRQRQFDELSIFHRIAMECAA